MSERPPSALRDRRLLSGLSQDRLAQQVGVSRQALNAIERGHAQPSVETAFALATVLGTTVEALFGGKQRAALPLPTREYSSVVLVGWLVRAARSTDSRDMSPAYSAPAARSSPRPIINKSPAES